MVDANGPRLRFHQSAVETVVACRHGRVRGEHAVLLHERLCFGERLLRLQLLAEEFQRQECGVPFVHVEDRRVDAQFAHEPYAADAEEDLLADAVRLIAAVHMGGEVAVELAVLRQVGVEQEERHASDPDRPCLELNIRIADRHAADDPVALLVVHRTERQAGRIERRVEFLLPALVAGLLAEVPLTVEDADAVEGDAEVAGGFCMVAGEDAEAAGIDAEAFMQAELGAEICHRGMLQ